MRLRGLLLATENFSLWPFLPAVAVVLLTVFTWSLAIAAPLPQGSRVVAARIGIENGGAISTAPLTATDGATAAEAAIFNAPLAAPHYHDRYRFYHRYDLNDPRAPLGPTPDDLD